MTRKTAIIVGSGIAGLSIAEILSRNNWKVVILESQDKIGGEASLATQKWYHTGWLYACLPNTAAMMGCYSALHLYQTIYENIFTHEQINLDLSNRSANYLESKNGWFTNENIFYFYAMSTYELSLSKKLYWPIYLRVFPLRRLRNLNYRIETITDYSDEMKELLNFWEKDSNGFNKYKIIRSTDAKIETEKVTKSLVSSLSKDSEIITNCSFSLMENNLRTKIKIDGSVHDPDLLVLASGKAIPFHLREIGFNKAADKIQSIKSPLLVLKEALSYPDFIRFTPNVAYTINHIKLNVKEDKQVSTVGSYYSFPIEENPVIEYYEDSMCEKMGISKVDVLGSYYGIKTEYVDGATRRYNHALEKVNENTFFALAGKFSQFPLLVHDFVLMNDLSLVSNNDRDKIKIIPEIFGEIFPTKLLEKSLLAKSTDL